MCRSASRRRYRFCPLSRITIELGDGQTAATCECCGRRAPSVVGFAYRDDDAYAVYYAGWTEGHESRGVMAIIGIGDWSDDGTPEARRSFGLRMWEDDEGIKFTVLDPAESRYGENKFLGSMLSRAAALADPEVSEIFHIAEHIAQDDDRVRNALATGSATLDDS